MVQTAASFPLNNLPKVIELVGFDDLRKVVVDVGGASPNNVESAQHKQELCPTQNREVVNPSDLAEQRVSSTVWKQQELQGTINRVLQQVFVNSM